MRTYSISQLARLFGLSRSTLLYYDRIGLLCAPERTSAGYRRYSQAEYKKLERICRFRGAGLSLEDVRHLLPSKETSCAIIPEKRFKALEEQILTLRNQQHIIIAMLKKMKNGARLPVLDKEIWTDILAAAGMDASAMKRWHGEFEKRASKAHFEFLLSIGISENEARQIQKWARQIPITPPKKS
jgi:MerR family transcriptional regulator, thiopeptide resistance regulator